jgi:hypothetical protein
VREGLCLVAGGSRRAGGGAETLDATDRGRGREKSLQAEGTASSRRRRAYRRADALIVARCEVRYSGRLDPPLPETLRLLMIKSDGWVLVRADMGRCKP